MEEVDQLIMHLRSEEPERRSFAIDSLSTVTSPAVIAALIDVLEDENIDNLQKVTRILQEHGLASVEALLEALNHRSEQVRFHSVRLLGSIGDERAIEPLIRLGQQAAGPLQYEVIEALIKLKDPRAIQSLIQALGHQDKSVREVASKGLIEMRHEALPDLISALQNEQWMIRRMAAWLLGQLGDPQAIDPLSNALQQPDTTLRIEAARSLGKLQAIAALPILIKTIGDKDTSVQRAVIEALGAIKEEQAIPHMIGALKTIDWNQRGYIINAIAGMGNGAISPTLDALETLNPRIRIGAVEILKHFNEERITDALLELSSDSNQELRSAVVQALRSQTDRKAIGGLVILLGDKNHSVWSDAARAILTIGSQSRPSLIGALQHDERIVRARAATLLCRAETHKGATEPFRLTISDIPFLLDALHDDRSYHPYIARLLAHLKGDELAHTVSLIYQGHSQVAYLLDQLYQNKEWRHLSLLSSAIEELTQSMGKTEVRSALRILKATGKLQRKKVKDGFCSQHMARFTRQSHKSGIDYLGCRICGSTLFGIQTPQVVLVLDTYMRPLIDLYPSSVYVNGLRYQDSIDFDHIEIGHCNRETIRELCMKVGNDTDPMRTRKYEKVTCTIRRGASVGKEMYNLLNNQFAEVTYASKAR